MLVYIYKCALCGQIFFFDKLCPGPPFGRPVHHACSKLTTELDPIRAAVKGDKGSIRGLGVLVGEFDSIEGKPDGTTAKKVEDPNSVKAESPPPGRVGEGMADDGGSGSLGA